MEKTGFAYFVHRPRTADELSAPGCGGQNRAYTVVKTVTLGKIDYENFITDMKADRRFIEEYAPLCAEDDPWKCILLCPPTPHHRRFYKALDLRTRMGNSKTPPYCCLASVR